MILEQGVSLKVRLQRGICATSWPLMSRKSYESYPERRRLTVTQPVSRQLLRGKGITVMTIGCLEDLGRQKSG